MAQILNGDFRRNSNQTKQAYLFPDIKCGLVFPNKILWTCGKEKSVQDTRIILREVDSGRLGAAASHGYVTNFWPACATKWVPVSSYRRRKKRRRKGRRNGVRAYEELPHQTVALHLYSTHTPAWSFPGKHHDTEVGIIPAFPCMYSAICKRVHAIPSSLSDTWY